MARKTAPKIIRFTDGPQPSEADYAFQAEHPGTVFRNAHFVPPFRPTKEVPTASGIEQADGVSGAIPDAYRHMPGPAQAVEAFHNRFRPAASRPVDPAAPVPGLVADMGAHGLAKPAVEPALVPGLANSDSPPPLDTGWSSTPPPAKRKGK